MYTHYLQRSRALMELDDPLIMDVEGEDWVFLRKPREGDPDWWNAGDDEPPASPPLKVVFTAPAQHWTDAAPLGNGSLGAMVYGGVVSETLQLNHDTLWTGTPGVYTNPEAPGVLSRVRQLVDEGKYSEASTEAIGLSGEPSNVYQPLGKLNLDFGSSESSDDAYTAYIRELDVNAAMVKVTYTVGDVEFRREHFCSNPHQVLVNKISANKPGSLSFMISLDSELRHNSSATSSNQIVMTGSCPAKRIPPHANPSDNPQGILFSAVLNLQIGGDSNTIQIVDDMKLKVDGADWAVLLLAASTTFEGPFKEPSDSKKDPKQESLKTIELAKTKTFSQLFKSHLDDYQSLFNRVTLHLSKAAKNISKVRTFKFLSKLNHHENASKLTIVEENKSVKSEGSHCAEFVRDALVSTAERVKSFKIDEDPSLVELLFHYGRYLLISCSRPRTQVSNLQGIWNKDVEPAWDAAPHLNINLQMNYWPCLPCNLSECQQPLFDFIQYLAVNGSKTAKVNYKASGWVAHHVSDIWAKTSPDRGDPRWALWPMGGAWLCTHLWEHYAFTLDKEFLQKTAYSLMAGCASFLLDWLIDGPGVYLETNPSTSPEHYFIAPDGKTASVSYSTTMDISIIKEVFLSVISAAEILGRADSYLIEQIKAALLKLPPTRVSRDGSIMEWAQDFQDPDEHHRHLSHLFGLFPGHTITFERAPDLCKAAANSLYKRGDIGPGWSTTWKMALWARLRNSEHAYRMVMQLINLVDPDHESDFEGGLYSNLFTAHPPFQIDANFGFTAAIAEMLVQSTEQDLFLLPALPRDKWSEGCIRGLKARGGVGASICWKEGELHQVSLFSMNQCTVRRLHYNGLTATANLSSGTIYTFNKHLKCLRISSSPWGS